MIRQRLSTACLTAALLCGCADGPTQPAAPGPQPAARVVSNRVAGTAEPVPPPGFPHRVRACEGCFLRLADLRGADLAGVRLRGANLSFADLGHADLTGADLRDADLRGADLRDARLDGAVLDDADLGAATWTDGQRCRAGSTGACVPDAGLFAGAAIRRKSTAVFDLVSDDGPLLTIEALKWYGGHAGALTITYDSAYGTWFNHYLLGNRAAHFGVRIDHEVVTSFYEQEFYLPLLDRIRFDLLPLGHGLFGHGHHHVHHDSLSYEEAYASFRRCFELMTEWGFRPRAYAYPHSSGHLPSTQQAVSDAGFICARGSTLDLSQVYLCPGRRTSPDNWYYLPAVSMASQIPGYVRGHEQLRPILDEAVARTAWVILMYHAIGIPTGWGYYPEADFVEDLRAISQRDLWSVSMDDAAAYVRERNALRVGLRSVTGAGDLQLVFEDRLDDAVFDQPLTIQMGPIAAPRVAVETVAGTQEVAVVDGLARFDVVPDGAPCWVRLLDGP